MHLFVSLRICLLTFAGLALNDLSPILQVIFTPQRSGGRGSTHSFVANNYLSKYSSSVRCQNDYFSASDRWAALISNRRYQTFFCLQWKSHDIAKIRPENVKTVSISSSQLIFHPFSLSPFLFCWYKTQLKPEQPAHDIDCPLHLSFC